MARTREQIIADFDADPRYRQLVDLINGLTVELDAGERTVRFGLWADVVRAREVAEDQAAADALTEAPLRDEYLAIMEECRLGTATAGGVRRGLYLVMRIVARRLLG